MTARSVARWQGAYYVATGLAPLVSRRAFEAVTGHKRDWWLVQTVGLVVAPIGAGLLRSSRRERVDPDVRLIAAGAAAGLAAIDVVYVARGRLRWTYLLDAAVELAVLAAWRRT